MSHVDEGTLHALLDGELAPAEVLEVQTHFATCPACSSRLDDARKLLAETERLVTALEAAAPLGGEAATARTARPVATPPPPRRPVEPPARPAATPPLPAASPETLVLIPNNPTATEIRRSRLKVMGWAAGFLVVIGAGVLGVQMRNGFFDKKPAGTLKIRPEEFSAPGGSDLPPPKPAAQPQGALGLSIPPPESTSDQARNAPSAAAPASQAPPAAKPAPPAATAASGPAPTTKPAPQAASGIFPSAEDRQAIVDRAAKATEELDRERNRERAAAATAALDAQRKQAAARQAAAQANPTPAPTPAPPPVPTIDQRSRIANRIGLDEAARQLGGPLHAIDGMSRQLVGAVSPQLVPGSDTSRAVVRAVYVDRAGRLIFLDQQRVRPGQADLPFTPHAERNGELRWMAGQVMLVLQGDLPTDSLRLLYRRVR